MIPDRVFVGIDVSKNRFDVHFHPGGERLAVPNEAAAVAALARRLRSMRPVAIGLEASGGYERGLARRLHAAGLAVYVLAPAAVRHFARALRRPAKTDPIDAAMIARYLELAVDELSPYAPDPRIERLDALVTHRRRLAGEASTLRGQMDTIDEPTVCRMIKARLATLRMGMLTLDKAIRQTIAECPAMTALFKTLVAVKGVGPVLAATLIAGLPELGRIGAKAVASLVGVAPHARQSGATDRHGRCSGGRAPIRAVLYMAVLSAIKAKAPHIEPFYQRLRQNGKPFKLAITAAMRKFITILNAIVRDAASFQIQAP
ncbi:MAG: IS110 family transposase [Bradyrhizobium sp.]